MCLPTAFCEHMRCLLGQAYESFVAALQQPAPVSVRIHPQKKHQITSDDRVPWSATGYYLNRRPSFAEDPLWHAGTYYVQEASSMFLEQAVLQLFSGSLPQRVLDLCAAPGGKSLHLLSLLSANSVLVSNEMVASRNHLLRENLIKWGYPNVVVTRNEPHDFRRLPAFFDLIVADVPCSGEGLFRKDQSARMRWSPALVDQCARRQRKIIADILPALKPGGILIYSTCTFNTTENEEVIAYLTQHHAVKPVSLTVLPEWNLVLSPVCGGYRFYPHRVRGEGFFIAVLRKEDSIDKLPAFSPSKTVFSLPERIHDNKRISLNKLLSDSSLFDWYYYQYYLHFFPQSKREDLSMLLRRLNVLSFGTRSAAFKPDIVPQHDLAMSVFLNSNYFSQIEIAKEHAIQFLKKEYMPISASNGWHLITHQQVPLGFIKKTNQRYNNYYPAAWRLRQ